MKKYYMWVIGCQMNLADANKVAARLESLGYVPTDRELDADVIVLNTCVVRQSAEDKAAGRISSLKAIKKERPETVIAVMGCLVGNKPSPKLRERFPHVDVFMPPADPEPLVEFLERRLHERAPEGETPWAQSLRFQSMKEGVPPVTAFVPIVYGCSHACTYCIIPYRRGPERSRPAQEIVKEVEDLVAQGVHEVTLLGQIVDRYGVDLRKADPSAPDLADLLRMIHGIEGLWRIRFLTSHPSYLDDRILDAVAELPKVCEHIEVPVQAGGDEVLQNMKRGYTAEEYRALVHRIRERIPNASIATDIIVGFPGETAEQFQRTYDLMEELKLDVMHLARYSPRPGTVAARRMPDDVPDEEKWRRFRLLEDIQTRIASEKNARYVGKEVVILVERKQKGRWMGRTRNFKLVFFSDESDWHGRLARVKISWAGPWSMIGEVVGEAQPPS